MLALLSLAAIASATTPRPRINPLAPPAEMQRQLEALNKLPLPDKTQLGIAVLKAVQADAAHRNRCMPHKMAMSNLEPATLDAMVTGLIENGVIENGWLTSVRISDCPPADPIRVLVLRAADGQSLSAVFIGQGESFAWPSLVKDALRGLVGSAATKLRTADPNCTPKELTPTAVRILSQTDMGPVRYGIRYKGAWQEIWQFEACNHRIGVPISFRADGKGGAGWTISPEKVLYER
jgi:hypothetical protein